MPCCCGTINLEGLGYMPPRNGSVEEALAQIEAKHYADAFKMKEKPVVKVGMNFSLKDGVNTLEWRVV